MVSKTYEQAPKVGLDQLYQLIHLTWDGDLISKQWQAKLCDRGYAIHVRGWSVITEKGILALTELGLIVP